MRSRYIALALCAVVLMAVPAHASEHTFAATAQGTALKLTLTPPGGEAQGLTFGASTATVQSSSTESCEGVACATGAAAVEPFGETAQVVVTNAPQEDSAEAFSLPAELQPLLSATLGTGTASGTPAPSASGSATAGQVEVNLTQSLVGPIENELDNGVAEISEGLAPLLDPIGGGDPSGVVNGVREFVDDLTPGLAQNPIATVSIGESTAEAADSPRGDPGITTATATAGGATVTLLPTPVVAPDGLFIIEAGAATATARTDGTTATTSSKGSVLRLRVRDLRDPTDPTLYQVVDIATDQPEQCFGESPLMLCVIVGGTAESGEGPEAGAVAAAVRIQALADADTDPGNPLPGLTLAVAEAIAGVNAALPGAPVTEPDEPDEDEPTLPATGGGMAALGVAVLAAGGLMARRLQRRD